jgi:catechol 2,3-dioxygenase-like lactoylglutathione lyase family enzyme
VCGKVRFLLLPFAAAREGRPSYCSEPIFSIDLIVADLNAAKSRLESNGVEILADPAPNDSRFFIRDPDGLVIEVMAA